MSNWAPKKSTGALLLKDGKVFKGFGCGYEGNTIGEVCFNTAMTGYQEIMTDPIVLPSYPQPKPLNTFQS